MELLKWAYEFIEGNLESNLESFSIINNMPCNIET